MSIKTSSGILLLLVTITSPCLPQNQERPFGFVSIHAGGFVLTSERFSQYFDKKFPFVYGGSLGVFTGQKTAVIGSATYISTTGTVNALLQRDTPPYFDEIAGASSLKEWLLNLGVQIQGSLPASFDLGLTFGLSIAIVNEEKPSIGYSTRGVTALAYDRHNFGVGGLFLGAGVGRSIAETGASVWGEASYNHLRGHSDAFLPDYGGLRLTLGVKYDLRF